MLLQTPKDMQQHMNPCKRSFMAQNIIINHNIIIEVETLLCQLSQSCKKHSKQVLTCKHIRAAAEMIGEMSIQKSM